MERERDGKRDTERERGDKERKDIGGHGERKIGDKEREREKY